MTAALWHMVQTIAATCDSLSVIFCNGILLFYRVAVYLFRRISRQHLLISFPNIKAKGNARKKKKPRIDSGFLSLRMDCYKEI